MLHEFKNMLWYKKLCEKYRGWEDGYTHNAIKNELLVHNDDDEMIPKDFTIMTYLVEDDDDDDLYGITYLSEVDSKILDIKITDEENLMDRWTYDSEIDVLKDKLIEKSNILIDIILRDITEIEDNLVSPEDDSDYDKNLKYQEDESKIKVLNTRRFYFEERRDELTEGTYN
jgi:hypothetical protein